MKHFVNTALCGALFLAALSIPTVRADEWDKRTVVTFSDQVQVPGKTLPAGKYLFKLVESSSNRYIVQISNERENHVFATIIAIPNYHLTPVDKTQISFYEVPAGQAPAVKAWFYPGDNYGRQFVYPKGEAAILAKSTTDTVPTEEPMKTAEITTNDQVATTTNDQPTVTETKSTDTVAVVEETKPIEETKVTTDVDQTVQPQPEPTPNPSNDQVTTDDNSTTTMPSTASNFPLVGLLGLFSLISAFALRALARS